MFSLIRNILIFAIILLPVCFLCACWDNVSEDDHEAVVKDLSDTQKDLLETQNELKVLEQELDQATEQLDEIQQAINDIQSELAGIGSSPTPTPTEVNESQGDFVRVTEVVDGDTIKILTQSGTADTVRLLGVDSPETSQLTNPTKFDGRTSSCLDTFGLKAKEYAIEVLEGRQVILQYDDTAGSRGYYDRALAYVIINGSDFNATLLEKGYARVYDESDFGKKVNYLNLEAEAKNEGIGLWGCPTPTPPPFPCECSGNLYSCSDFETQAQAQACYDYCFSLRGFDIHGLDGNDDGEVCEYLP